MTCSSHIHVSLRMNCNDFGDLSTSDLPSSHLSIFWFITKIPVNQPQLYDVFSANRQMLAY